MVTADDLRKADAAYRAASADAEVKRLERRKLIHQALAEGWTHRRVAEVLDLSRGRISQL